MAIQSPGKIEKERLRSSVLYLVYIKKTERLEQMIKLHDGRDLHMLHSHTVPGTQEIVNKASGLNE